MLGLKVRKVFKEFKVRLEQTAQTELMVRLAQQVRPDQRVQQVQPEQLALLALAS
jgi:hypothetical protein